MAVVTAMLIYGLVMVFSASYPYSVLGEQEHPWYFVGLQLAWIGVGLVVMLVAARIPYTIWEKWSVPLMAVTLIALIVLLVFGNERFGSTRTFIGGSVQPSQPAKVIITIYVAAWLASKGDRIRSVSVGLIPFAVGMGFLTVLIVLQPSISTAFLIVATASVMFFIAGAALGQLAVILLGGAATFWFIVRYSSYAGDRLQNYISSVGNPLTSNEFQVQQTVQALTTGGPVGVGIGQGTAQMPGFVPLAWSDNIYAVIGEELGLIGTLLVIVLFGLLAYRGLTIAMKTRDPFGMLLAIGLTTMIIIQAMLNVAVVIAVLPPTGVPLPFFSYGGSSLVTAMAAVGLLFSISRFGPSARPRSVKNPSAGSSGSGSGTNSSRAVPNASVDLGRGDGGTRLSGAGSRGGATAGGRTATAGRGAGSSRSGSR
jgi:cell division protein FtsW